MVLQLGNWGLVPGQNPAIRHGCQADSWPARRVVSQSIRHSVSPASSESMHGHAVTCCLGQTKLCGQHLLVAHFAAFCFWLTGSLREGRRRRVGIGYPLAASRLFCNAQITLSICPVRLYNLAYCIHYGIHGHPRVFQGIHTHPRANQATTLTSLISGMRGNVAI